jgi:hypothetical protein
MDPTDGWEVGSFGDVTARSFDDDRQDGSVPR